MKHVREIELIEFVARRLDGRREQALRSHIEACSACRLKLESLEKTWDILGAWQVQPAGGIDITRLVDSSKSHAEDFTGSIIRFPRAATALRIAAAIAVATVAGYTGGHWSIRPSNADRGAEPPRYVSVLALEIGVSLSPLVLQDESTVEPEGAS